MEFVGPTSAQHFLSDNHHSRELLQSDCTIAELQQLNAAHIPQFLQLALTASECFVKFLSSSNAEMIMDIWGKQLLRVAS